MPKWFDHHRDVLEESFGHNAIPRRSTIALRVGNLCPASRYCMHRALIHLLRKASIIITGVLICPELQRRSEIFPYGRSAVAAAAIITIIQRPATTAAATVVIMCP